MKRILLLLLSTLFLTSCQYTKVMLVSKFDYSENIRPYPVKDTTDCAIGFKKFNTDTNTYYTEDYDCTITNYFNMGDTLLVHMKKKDRNRK